MRSLPVLKDRQAEPPAAYCRQCGGEVYAGERLYIWEGRRLCSDCFRAALNAADLDQLALELGLEVERLESP